MKKGLVLGACMITLFTLSGCGNSSSADDKSSSSSTSSKEKKSYLWDDGYYHSTKQKDSSSSESSSEKDVSEYQGVSYDQIARTPDDFEYKSITVTGQVMQVQNSDDGTIVLLWQNDDSDSLVMVNVDSDDMPTNGNILEDDELTIYGYGAGTQKYDTASGSSNEVPLIITDKAVVDNGKSESAY